MAYTIIPGVRQDHKGRLYRVAVYPNGKGIMVPAQSADGLEPARMIPVPPEPTRKVRPILKLQPGVKVHRHMVVEVRWKGNKHISKAIATQEFVDHSVRALCVFDGADLTKIKRVFGECDWFQQRIEETSDAS